MKKIFSVILCVAAVLLVGCSDDVQDRQVSYYQPAIKSEPKTSQKEAEASKEEEIQEVDEWGVSLDDVDRLAKEAIRKNEIKSEYRSDYNKHTRAMDSLLKDVQKGSSEYSLDDLLKKHGEACEAGIEYIEAHVGGDVKWSYDLFTNDGEFDKSEKDLIRTILTLWNNTIQAIEQSETDMKSLLDPIISENRKLTDDEIQQVNDIYQILIDNVYKVNG